MKRKIVVITVFVIFLVATVASAWNNSSNQNSSSVIPAFGNGEMSTPNKWLVGQLTGNKNSYVRSVSALALSFTGDASTVEPLISALKDDEVWVRCYAAEVLGCIGDARAVEPLIKVLKDEDAGVRSAAIDALVKIGDMRVVEPLVSVMLSDPDSFVRIKAGYAISTLQPSDNVSILNKNLRALTQDIEAKSEN